MKLRESTIEQDDSPAWWAVDGVWGDTVELRRRAFEHRAGQEPACAGVSDRQRGGCGTSKCEIAEERRGPCGATRNTNVAHGVVRGFDGGRATNSRNARECGAHEEPSQGAERRGTTRIRWGNFRLPDRPRECSRGLTGFWFLPRRREAERNHGITGLRCKRGNLRAARNHGITALRCYGRRCNEMFGGDHDVVEQLATIAPNKTQKASNLEKSKIQCRSERISCRRHGTL